MAQVKTYSLRNEDEELYQWLLDRAGTTPGGESGVVREALYRLMQEGEEREEVLKNLEAGQERIELRQVEMIAILRVLKGREPGW